MIQIDDNHESDYWSSEIFEEFSTGFDDLSTNGPIDIISIVDDDNLPVEQIDSEIAKIAASDATIEAGNSSRSHDLLSPSEVR